MRKLSVHIARDETAKVWITDRSSVIGLTTESRTKKGIIKKIKAAAPVLLELDRDSTRFFPDPAAHYEITIEEHGRLGKAKKLHQFNVRISPS